MPANPATDAYRDRLEAAIKSCRGPRARAAKPPPKHDSAGEYQRRIATELEKYRRPANDTPPCPPPAEPPPPCVPDVPEPRYVGPPRPKYEAGYTRKRNHYVRDEPACPQAGPSYGSVGYAPGEKHAEPMATPAAQEA